MSGANVLALHGVSKRYGTQVAVDALDLDLDLCAGPRPDS